MIFQPIAMRELRRASRRSLTYWGRAAVALVVGAWTLWTVQNLDGSVPPAQTGAWLFRGLSRLGFLVCLLPGVFLTADCLSEEKRNGTLGLLFLTDLTGWEIMLGKLAATSLTALFGMLAMLPILAMPMLLGGLTAGEVFRVALVWINTVLFSLTTGLAVSAISWNQQKAVVGTAVFLLVVGVILPLAGLPLGPEAPLEFAWAAQFRVNPAPFVLTLALAHGWAWICLLGAPQWVRSSLMRRSATPLERKPPIQTVSNDYPTLSSEEQMQLAWVHEQLSERQRVEMLNRNPMEWLTQARPRALVWISIGLAMPCWLIGNATQGRTWESLLSQIVALIVIHAILKGWLLWEASWRFTKERSAGLLELLLVTPLRASDFIRAQLSSLRRLFLMPALAVLAFDALLIWTELMSGNSQSTGVIVAIGLVMAMFLADGFALMGLGFWHGLRTGQAWQGALACLWKILGVPTAISLGAFFVLVTADALQTTWGWTCLMAVWGTVGLITPLWLGTAAWRDLRINFRRLASENFTGHREGAE